MTPCLSFIQYTHLYSVLHMSQINVRWTSLSTGDVALCPDNLRPIKQTSTAYMGCLLLISFRIIWSHHNRPLRPFHENCTMTEMSPESRGHVIEGLQVFQLKDKDCHFSGITSEDSDVWNPPISNDHWDINRSAVLLYITCIILFWRCWW